MSTRVVRVLELAHTKHSQHDTLMTPLSVLALENDRGNPGVAKVNPSYPPKTPPLQRVRVLAGRGMGIGGGGGGIGGNGYP